MQSLTHRRRNNLQEAQGEFPPIFLGKISEKIGGGERENLCDRKVTKKSTHRASRVVENGKGVWIFIIAKAV